jgi:acyl-CoA synthetase (AMP-forming)/AMP-acid ligase II
LELFSNTFSPYGFHKEAFCPAYGMAETTVMVSLCARATTPTVQTLQRQPLEQNQVELAKDQQESPQRALVGCGQVGQNHTLVIVDPQTSRRCLPNQVGEIWISGPSIAQGYWNRPEETEKTFKAYLADTGEGPFLRTGDMGFLQGDELFITGRQKDVIILWGRNHYPHHIEMTVEQSHPALRPGGGAVFGIEIDGEEQLVVAQEVEARSLRSLDTDIVIDAIRQALVSHHMVDTYAIVLLRPGSIPKTPTGKTQRTACRAQFLEGSLNVITQWINSQPANGIVLDPVLVAATT